MTSGVVFAGGGEPWRQRWQLSKEVIRTSNRAKKISKKEAGQQNERNPNYRVWGKCPANPVGTV
jgi:hypothetical protein